MAGTEIDTLLRALSDSQHESDVRQGACDYWMKKYVDMKDELERRTKEHEDEVLELKLELSRALPDQGEAPEGEQGEGSE